MVYTGEPDCQVNTLHLVVTIITAISRNNAGTLEKRAAWTNKFVKVLNSEILERINTSVVSIIGKDYVAVASLFNCTYTRGIRFNSPKSLWNILPQQGDGFHIFKSDEITWKSNNTQHTVPAESKDVPVAVTTPVIHNKQCCHYTRTDMSCNSWTHCQEVSVYTISALIILTITKQSFIYIFSNTGNNYADGICIFIIN